MDSGSMPCREIAWGQGFGDGLEIGALAGAGVQRPEIAEAARKPPAFYQATVPPGTGCDVDVR